MFFTLIFRVGEVLVFACIKRRIIPQKFLNFLKIASLILVTLLFYFGLYVVFIITGFLLGWNWFSSNASDYSEPWCRTIFLLAGLSLESHRTLFWKSFHPQFLHKRWRCSWSPLPICCTMLPFATFIDSRCLEHFLKSHGPCWEIPSIPNFWHEHWRCSRLHSHEEKKLWTKIFLRTKIFSWTFWTKFDP